MQDALADEVNSDVKIEQVMYTTLAPGGWDLLQFNSSEKSSEVLTLDRALDYNPTCSPNGRWIVFTSERSGNPDLWALDLTDKDAAPILLTDLDTMQDAAEFAPDGESLAFVETRDGNAEIYVMPFRPRSPHAAFEQARNLTRSPRGDFRPAFAPDGRRIAFCSDAAVPNRPGWPEPEDAVRRGLPESPPWPIGGDIYLMNVDGSDRARLTDANDWDGSPAWSKDGQTIYFYSTRERGIPHIWSMKADGSQKRSLGTTGLSPAVMHNGRVAFSAPKMNNGQPDFRSWRIFSVATDGSELREEGPDRDCRGPKFHPISGDLICYGGQRTKQMFADYMSTRTLRAVGQHREVRLPDRKIAAQGLHRLFPSFSHDGGSIVSAVMVTRNEADGTRLIISPIDGAAGTEVFRPRNPNFNLGLAWGGEWIVSGLGAAFVSESTQVDVWKVHPDGSGAVNLTSSSDANDAWPDISADGNRIVFRSGRDGNFEIYSMDADGRNIHRLTNHRARDTMPAISPDGRRVAFSSNRAGHYAMDFDIYLIELTEQGERGQIRRLTDDADSMEMHVRFSPDGKWIVYTSNRGGFNDELDLCFQEAGQAYGEIYAQRLSDGHVVRLTHNKWEDGPTGWGKVPPSTKP